MGSRQHLEHIKHGKPRHFTEDIRAYKREYAEALDAEDPLRQRRDDFIVPTIEQLKSKKLPEPGRS